jgi:uncharacterized membrane-anchored protein YhcB (DUF1043 family)
MDNELWTNLYAVAPQWATLALFIGLMIKNIVKGLPFMKIEEKVKEKTDEKNCFVKVAEYNKDIQEHNNRSEQLRKDIDKRFDNLQLDIREIRDILTAHLGKRHE